MNNLEVFEFEGNKVRTQIDQDGNVWFRVKDVCEVLGVKNYRDVVAKLEKDDVDLIDTIDSLGRTQSVRYTNESGLYDIVLQSRKPEARKFRRWVTSEVLPSIRKTGSYSLTPPTLDSYQIEDPILRAQKWIEEQKEKVLLLEESKLLNARLEEVKPKEEFYDKLIDLKDGVTLGEAAKALNFKGMGQNNLFAYLRQCYMLTYLNTPMQHCMDKGYFQVKCDWIELADGSKKFTSRTYVTPKGIEKIYGMLKDREEAINKLKTKNKK
jgi:prophage antirepressor-like protein